MPHGRRETDASAEPAGSEQPGERASGGMTLIDLPLVGGLDGVPALAEGTEAEKDAARAQIKQAREAKPPTCRPCSPATTPGPSSP